LLLPPVDNFARMKPSTSDNFARMETRWCSSACVLRPASSSRRESPNSVWSRASLPLVAAAPADCSTISPPMMPQLPRQVGDFADTRGSLVAPAQLSLLVTPAHGRCPQPSSRLGFPIWVKSNGWRRWEATPCDWGHKRPSAGRHAAWTVNGTCCGHGGEVCSLSTVRVHRED